jgi:citrate synthase
MAEEDTFITRVQRPARRTAIDGAPSVQKPTNRSHMETVFHQYSHSTVEVVAVVELLDYLLILLHCHNQNHKHFATLTITSANHVYVTSTFELILI